MASYPPDLEEYVQRKVRSGEFASRDDFTAEAVRFYRELEERHQRLKADIAVALDEVQRGEDEPFDIESIKQELLDNLDEQGNPR